MCTERNQLIDYVYDECDASERRRVEAHLETCESCRDELAGLRAVRQDLLAWGVPEHGSVWRPFAPPRLVPSWRDVPAWALAAAAGVMFLIGAAGGAATRALVPLVNVAAGGQTQASVSLPTPAVTEQQIRDFVRAEVDQRVVPVSAHEVVRTSPGVPPDEMLRRVQQLISLSEMRQGQQLNTSVQSLFTDLQNFQITNKREFASLKDQVNGHEAQLKGLLAQQPVR
jgi:anti-sigma factor RsiW